MRGRATGGWPAERIETWGNVEKDCLKAAPKEERIGKTCESNEWERTSQIGRPKITGFIRCANAGFVVEKTLASWLAKGF